MLRFAPLLLLPLLLAACALPVRDGMVLRAPQESPTAALQGIEGGKQAQNAPQATQKPAEVQIDYVATQTAILDALAVSQGQTAALQKQLADENIRRDEIALQIEQAKVETAKYQAAIGASETAKIEAENERLRLTNETKRLDNERIKLDVELAQAQAAIADARTRALVALFVIVAACVAGIWFTPRMRQPRQGVAVEAEPPAHDPFPELQKLNRPIIPVSDTTLDTDTNPPGNIDKFRAYVDYALQGWALGQNSVVKAKIYGSHPEYKEVLTWMRKKRYTSEQNGQIGLSDKGKRDLKLWSYDFNPPTG